MTDDYSGKETFADILKIVLEHDFSSDEINQHGATASITYQHNVPFLRFQAQVRENGEFLGHYRLDQMMARVFEECERVCADLCTRGVLGKADDIAVRRTTLHVARYAMNMTLRRLMLLQLAMFEDNFYETMFLTSGLLLQGVSRAYEEHPNFDELSKAANKGIRKLLEDTLDHTVRIKRRLLVDLLNSVGLLHIPTGVGRPKGTTKPKNKRIEDARAFEQQVEQTIRHLLTAKGKMPTKTDVAKQLGIGGVNPNTMRDSRLSAFRNKLKRLGLDYELIAEKAKVNK